MGMALHWPYTYLAHAHKVDLIRRCTSADMGNGQEEKTDSFVVDGAEK